MTNLISAAKAALEALGKVKDCEWEENSIARRKLISDLRTAIKEAEKVEPVAWIRDGDLKILGAELDACLVSATKDFMDRLPLYLHPAPTVPGWIRAVDEELVVCCIGIAESSDDYETARKKLHELIQWHIDVATNPAVNGGYKLIAREPTEEMLDVVTANHKKHPTVPDRWKGNMTRIFQAMWDEAPEVPHGN